MAANSNWRNAGTYRRRGDVREAVNPPDYSDVPPDPEIRAFHRDRVRRGAIEPPARGHAEIGKRAMRDAQAMSDDFETVLHGENYK